LHSVNSVLTNQALVLVQHLHVAVVKAGHAFDLSSGEHTSDPCGCGRRDGRRAVMDQHIPIEQWIKIEALECRIAVLEAQQTEIANELRELRAHVWTIRRRRMTGHALADADGGPVESQ
jgi:hypothetical protein